MCCYRREGEVLLVSNHALVWSWGLAGLAVLVLVLGLYFQSTWWILSTPIALVGAIVAGVKGYYVPMTISIAVVAVLFLVMMLFAP